MKNIQIYTDGFEGYAKRGLARGKKLTKGEKVPTSNSITFDSPKAMAECLTDRRVELFEELARSGPVSMSKLASQLKRDPKSVRSDVYKLARLGMVRMMGMETNPGHGQVRIVGPVARRLNLKLSIGA